jgi:hypothetical protein
MPTRIVKIATPILIAGFLVFYGIRRAENNPRAGPTCRIVIEVRWTELVKQQKAGKVDESNLEGLKNDGLQRQNNLVNALRLLTSAENLETVGVTQKGEPGEVDASYDLKVVIQDTIFDKKEGELPLAFRTETLIGDKWLFKVGNVGEYGDAETITVNDITLGARRWRMKHFWRYIL